MALEFGAYSPPGTPQQKCAHCGRTGMVYGMFSPARELGVFYLCHANMNGTKADPDCYTDVTHNPDTWWTIGR